MAGHRVLHDMFVAPFVVPDPGASGTIYLDRWGSVVPVVTAAAEARTLAQPTKAGLVCMVVLDTDGGDLTLTVTGGYNVDADTSITFGDAGDFVVFASTKVGSYYYWRVLSQEGTNLTMENMNVDSLEVGGVAVAPADMTPGTGISSATGEICEHRVTKIAGIYKTEILIDLTTLHSMNTDGDIIGKDGGTANSHIGQITAAVNGTIVAGRITCFELPAGGDPNIMLYSATEGTGAEDAAISGLTETLLYDRAADWAAGDIKVLASLPAANEYLYLVQGDATGTDADYTAGILLIELWGV